MKTKIVEVEINDYSNLTNEEIDSKAIEITLRIMKLQKEEKIDFLAVVKNFLEMKSLIEIIENREVE